jgi:ribose transport system permease protein
MTRAGDNGILIVLLVLVVAFSAATYGEQPAVGRAGANSLARLLDRETAAGASIVIVSGFGPEEAEFADELHERLQKSGRTIAGDFRGGPADVRQQLEALHDLKKKVDAIAGSATAAGWAFLEEPARRYTSWPSVRFIEAPPYWWPSFLLADNLRNIVTQIAVIAIVAIGMTMVIATGGIDLSVGALMAFAAVLSTLLIRDFAGGVSASAAGQVVCCALAIVLCAVMGGVTGLLVTLFRLPSFIASLGMMWIGRGLAYKLCAGQSINEVPSDFSWLGRGAAFAGVPNIVVLMAALYAVAVVLMNRTVLGRHILAVGSNARAALLSGVPIRRTLLFVYIASGTLAGLGGIILASQLQTGDPKFGQEYELYVITAVVVGGTSLSGGQGRVFGTLLGALLISVVHVGMNLLGIDSYTRMVVLGTILLAAVLVDQLRKRRRAS